MAKCINKLYLEDHMKDLKQMSDSPLSKTQLRAGKIDRASYDSMPKTPITLILDSLKSAHNIGTILRLAEAVRAEKVYICGNTIVPPNAKIKQSSKGAERWVPWEYVERTIDAVNKVKEENKQVISVEVSQSSKLYTEVDYTYKPCALVLGREYDGVTPEVLSASDKVVHLPMYGMANSINVSCAAAVLVYHAMSQIEKSPSFLQTEERGGSGR